MIIFPSDSTSPTDKPSKKYYPSFDPTALDGFYSVFNRPYESAEGKTREGNPRRRKDSSVSSSQPAPQISSNPFLAAMGDFGATDNVSNLSSNPYSVSAREANSLDTLMGAVADPTVSYTQSSPENSGKTNSSGKTNTLDTMVNLATSYTTGGIGGKISAVTGLIGLISGLFNRSGSEDSPGYDSNSLGQGSADSAAGVGDSAGSGDGQGDAGSGSSDSDSDSDSGTGD
jgi:hypothetical protein